LDNDGATFCRPALKQVQKWNYQVGRAFMKERASHGRKRGGRLGYRASILGSVANRYREIR